MTVILTGDDALNDDRKSWEELSGSFDDDDTMSRGGIDDVGAIGACPN